MSEQRSAVATVREIRRKTRRKYYAEEKIRIVLEGLRGEESIAELCRREGINSNLYYKWSKEFLEAGKKRLTGDTKREATSGEVRNPGWIGPARSRGRRGSVLSRFHEGSGPAPRASPFTGRPPFGLGKNEHVGLVVVRRTFLIFPEIALG